MDSSKTGSHINSFLETLFNYCHIFHHVEQMIVDLLSLHCLLLNTAILEGLKIYMWWKTLPYIPKNIEERNNADFNNSDNFEVIRKRCIKVILFET